MEYVVGRRNEAMVSTINTGKYNKYMILMAVVGDYE